VELLLQAVHERPEQGSPGFDALCWAVKTVFTKANPGQLTITDSQTRETSTLTHVGEDISIQTLPAESEPPESVLVIYRAIFTIRLTELISPA
jgi:hypothetical protein